MHTHIRTYAHAHTHARTHAHAHTHTQEMTREEANIIRKWEKCDFTQIHEYYKERSEERKQMSKEEKAAVKAENEKILAEYGWAIIDGHRYSTADTLSPPHPPPPLSSPPFSPSPLLPFSSSSFCVQLEPQKLSVIQSSRVSAIEGLLKY